eukprot:TRINITY_DN29972_c0_g1_i1.p1 TRINITY_DN29972_c0_g1~~TRINITY_DN29972_c0_g1_i1.p1  ORF type:complete len:331 (+),score=80.93 TRINITY_DN29972_c0_g1_i1:191-1183(+)
MWPFGSSEEVVDQELPAQQADPIVREALLRDPQVQLAMRQAGEEALRDPAVQRQIVQVCQEKYPEAAAAVASQVARWAQDPDLQDRAKGYAGMLAERTMSAVASAPHQIVNLIEQGPVGVRYLAFAGGIAQSILAFMTLLSLLLGLGLIAHPVESALYSFQFVFSLTTALFEVPPDTVEMWPILDRWQNALLEDAKFFSKTRGRGLFYIFLGSLWLYESDSMSNLPSFTIGLYMSFVGVVHVMISCGYSTQHIAQKIREGGQAVRRATLRLVSAESARDLPDTLRGGLHGGSLATASSPLYEVEMPDAASSRRGGAGMGLPPGDNPFGGV